jgi:hypothetical protein
MHVSRAAIRHEYVRPSKQQRYCYYLPKLQNITVTVKVAKILEPIMPQPLTEITVPIATSRLSGSWRLMMKIATWCPLRWTTPKSSFVAKESRKRRRTEIAEIEDSIEQFTRVRVLGRYARALSRRSTNFEGLLPTLRFRRLR